MSIKRECIKAGFVVTMRQYGEFVGHELFLRCSELLEELDNYREARFTSLEIVGISHRGSYLSPGAMAVVIDQVSTRMTAGRLAMAARTDRGETHVAIQPSQGE